MGIGNWKVAVTCFFSETLVLMYSASLAINAQHHRILSREIRVLWRNRSFLLKRTARMARLGAHNLLKLVFYQWHNLQRHLLLLGRVKFLKMLFFPFILQKRHEEPLCLFYMRN